MRLLVDAFNQGEIDRVLVGVAADVEVLIPLYRIDETAGASAFRSKEELRERLLRRYKSGVRIELSTIYDAGGSAIATLKSSKEGQLAVTFKFNDQGLAHRIIVFKQ